MSATLEPADLARFARFGISPELLSAAHVQRVDDREAKEVFGIQYSGDKAGIIFPYYFRPYGLNSILDERIGYLALCAGINRHVVGDARAPQEGRQRLHPDL
jgi:hypothetical protein